MNTSTNGANMVVLDRVFVILITEDDKMPFEEGWKGEFAVSVPPTQAGEAATIGLAPVQSIMQVPNNAILCANPNEGILLLQKIKAELKPNMSGKSGLQACVVHTEALFDMQTGNLAPNLMLFPVGFMPYDDMVKAPTPEQIAAAQGQGSPLHIVEKPSEGAVETPKEGEGTPTITEEEKAVLEGPTDAVEATPADNPAPATATMTVKAPEAEA